MGTIETVTIGLKQQRRNRPEVVCRSGVRSQATSLEQPKKVQLPSCRPDYLLNRALRRERRRTFLVHRQELRHQAAVQTNGINPTVSFKLRM